ncbi:Bifunctional PGK/TIM [Bremerella volcania]|uniref:Phosphoglycerate kinase n=1 Tax=Bremerella volcania TaxID=2527984 RepID=A0A518C5U0_9BACT|nr:phosphoglycerate kinase [Bremerella volcania]QDU74574.1 Bifunctional PGK/TIM [Bremerella volcania]
MKFLDQIDLKGKKLLIRVDYNVPLKDSVIQDDNRIRASVPTLHYAIAHEAAVIICSHLGRPKGTRVAELSLAPAAKSLSEILQTQVRMASDCIGPEVAAQAAAIQPGQLLMLENLRFHAEEEQNDPAFSQHLAELADVYVNDAFAVAHRTHASVVGVTSYANVCCAGFLVKKERQYLGDALENPERPYVAISGGAKVSTKLGVLNHLLDKADALIIGGAMANTFLFAQGFAVGKSRVEKDLAEDARSILEKADSKGVALHLPVDFVLGESPDCQTAAGTCNTGNIPDDLMVLDVGPKSLTRFEQVLKPARTVMWNGPLGVFENRAFANGSQSIAKSVASLSDAVTIVGGGETGALIHMLDLAADFSFVSTGGGSFLRFLEGNKLPAFDALDNWDNRSSG